MYFGRSSGFVGSGSLSSPFDSSSSFDSSLLDHRVNHIDLCSILQYPGHLVNHMTPSFQFTSGLCSTSQSCPRNRFVFLISDTTILIYLMCPFELIFKGTNSLILFSLFLDPSELYMSDGFGSDFFSTVFLAMVVFVHPKSFNALTLSFLLFFVLIVRYTISSLDCSLLCGITYQFLVELFTVVHRIMPTLNLWQNPSTLHPLSSLVVNSWSSFVEMLCTLWQYVFLCHTWNILVVSFPSLVVSNLLPCVQICYSCNTWLCILVCYSVVILFLLCHKLHSAISPSILWRFSHSQWLWKALEKTFWLIPVMSRSDQWWPRY